MHADMPASTHTRTHKHIRIYYTNAKMHTRFTHEQTDMATCLQRVNTFQTIRISQVSKCISVGLAKSSTMHRCLWQKEIKKLISSFRGTNCTISHSRKPRFLVSHIFFFFLSLWIYCMSRQLFIHVHSFLHVRWRLEHKCSQTHCFAHSHIHSNSPCAAHSYTQCTQTQLCAAHSHAFLSQSKTCRVAAWRGKSTRRNGCW